MSTTQTSARPLALRERPLTRSYWRAWSAVGVSSVGDGLAFTALPLLAESLSKRGSWVTLVFAASRLPWLFFGLLAGAWVDTRPPRTTMIQMDAVRFLVMLTLGVAVLADVVSIPMVLAVAFIIGMADCAHIPAAAAFLPSIVKRGELDRANSYFSSAELAGEQFAGPSMGAVLFSWAPWIPFVADASSFVGSAALVRGVDTLAPEKTEHTQLSVRQDIAAGWAWFHQNRDLWTLTIFLCVGAGAAGMTNSALVLYGKRHLGLTNWQYGLFVSIPATGGLIGSWVAFRIWRRIGTRPLVAVSFAALAIAFFVCSQTKSPYIAGAAFVVDSFVPPLINTCIRTLRQQGVPAEFLGRVSSVGRLMFIGAAFAGAAIAGFIADLTSVASVYGVASFLVAATLVLGGIRLSKVRLELAERAEPTSH